MFIKGNESPTDQPGRPKTEMPSPAMDDFIDSLLKAAENREPGLLLETPKWGNRPNEDLSDDLRRALKLADQLGVGRDRPEENPKREEHPKPNPEERLALGKKAVEITALIAKNGDFYAGLKRERIEEAFKIATSAGHHHLKHLIEQINKGLAKTNPGLELKAEYSVKDAWYQRQSGVADPYYSPYKVSEPSSTVEIMNTKTKQIEDRIKSNVSRGFRGDFKVDPQKRGGLYLEVEPLFKLE